MAGVPGAGGSPPKREAQRRNKTKPPIPTETVEAVGTVEAPASDPGWHPVALQWFNSLARSGQAQFYEPSDWATAWMIAESMSREFSPQPISVGSGEFAHVEMVEYPPKGASLAAWLKAMTALMVTEGDRRRLRIELTRPLAVGEVAGVSWIDDARARLRDA